MSRSPKVRQTNLPLPLRFLIGLGNLALALALILQVTLIFWLLPDGEIPVPRLLLDKAQEQLAKHDLYLHTNNTEIDLRGYLTLHQPALNFISTGETAFQADSILIGFRPWALLFGQLSLDDIRVLRGTLYCPAVFSPTGTREPVCESLSLSAQSSGRWWNIDRLNLNLAGVRIALAGPLPQTILDTPDSMSSTSSKAGTVDSQHIRNLYERICRNLIEAREFLKPLNHPIILAQLDRENANGAGINLYAQFSSIDDFQGLTLGETFFTVYLNLANDRTLRCHHAATLVSYNLEYEHFYSHRTFAKITLADGPKGVLDIPRRILLVTYRPSAYGLDFDAAMFLGEYHDLDQIHVQATLKSHNDWLDVTGQLNLENLSTVLNLHSHWDPAFFLKATPFAEMGEIPPVHFSERPLFQATVTLGPDWSFQHTWMELESGPASYDSLHLKAIYTQADLVPGYLHLHHTILEAEDYTVTGSYQQDIETNDYRFLLQGNIRPTDISFIIEEDWWDELWGDFTFPHDLPYANIDLKGRYRAGDTNRFLYCRASLPQSTYRGIAVDSASAWLFQLPDVFDIIDLDVRSAQHSALANIQFLYTPGHSERRSLGFTGTSTLPLADLAGLIGPEATPYKDLFTSETPPFLRAAGMVYGDDSPHPDELTLKVEAHFTGQTVFQEITFDHVSFEGLILPHQVTMNDIKAGLASGSLTGLATLDTPRDGSPYNLLLDLNLQNASLLGLFTHIPPLFNIRTAAEERARQDANQGNENKLPPAEERYAGTFDITFVGQGNPDSWQSFEGTGKAALHDAQLGQLHLFGGLSRLVANLGLNFGTIDFTSARTSYTLDHGDLHLPDARIFGKTSSIDANGIYDIDNDNLNFTLSLHPFGAVETPVVSQLFGLLSPIANTIEVQLSGTLGDPEWNTSFGLLRAITGPRTITDK